MVVGWFLWLWDGCCSCGMVFMVVKCFIVVVVWFWGGCCVGGVIVMVEWWLL